MKDYNLVRNEKFGFYSVDPVPSREELESYYNASYYDYGTYAINYSEEEILQKELSAYELEYFLGDKKKGNILDVGCGEGFVLNKFFNIGWNVLGLDFSHDGVKRHFPGLLDKVMKGDINQSLQYLINKKDKFDVIICNNVLEHVVDPISFLLNLRYLCSEDTIIRIQVPNDFSWLQKCLRNDGQIKNDYWVCPPAHLSYFDNSSLLKVLSECGYEVINLLGDFPIELFLINKKSNYNLEKENGRFAHEARLYFDVNLFKTSIDRYMAFRKGCGESGVCRNLIAYSRFTNTKF